MEAAAAAAAAAAEGEIAAFLQQLLVTARDREPIPSFPVVIGVVLQGGLPRDGTGEGPPPASKASIEALRTVEAVEGEEDCPVCLDLLRGGGGVSAAVKEVPCGHRFHGACIEKWLGKHGSCPVCRYRMPAEGERDEKKGEEAGERRVLVAFGFARRDDGDQH